MPTDKRDLSTMKSSGIVTRSNTGQITLSIEEKLDLLLNDVSQIKKSNATFLNEISEIKNDLRAFKEDINKTIDLCYEKLEDCNIVVKKNMVSIVTCEENIEKLKGENVTLKRTVSELRKKMAAADQYSRSNSLEIQGVPESDKENVLVVVKQVAAALNFKLEDSMVDAVHRLSINPNKPNDPRGIILKFCRRIDLEEMRRRSRVKNSIYASELGYQSERRIYINMSLTRDTRALWAEVQSLKRRNVVKYAWITSTGKIFIRKREGEAAVLVAERSDLDCFK